MNIVSEIPQHCIIDISRHFMHFFADEIFAELTGEATDSQSISPDIAYIKDISDARLTNRSTDRG